MRIAAVRLGEFRGLRGLEADFARGAEEVPSVIALVGPTGAGKTSALQALTWALALASGRYRDPADLRWPGLTAATLEERAPEVTVRLVLDDSDRALIRRASRGGTAAEPPDVDRVVVRLHGGEIGGDPPPGTPGVGPLIAERLAWFPAERRPARRDLAVLTGERGGGAMLRESFLRVLPAVPMPRPGMGIDDLSAGQRSVLAILGHLLRHGRPAGSLVVVDAPELALDVPAQQALVREVRDRIAPGQLLIATASEAIAEMLPAEAVHRISLGVPASRREVSV